MPKRDPELAAALKKPFAEQVAFFRQKLGSLVPTARWDDLWQAEHDRAFMVAGAAKADLLADLAAAVDKAIADGETLEDFRERFFEIVDRRGWHGWTGEETEAGRAWRTRVIYETNLITSYAAGRHAQLVEGGYDWWIYKHSDFVLRPRPHHVALDGIVRRADDPFWRTHYPPNGWGCRCRVVGARGPASIERLGGDPDKPMPAWVGEIDEKTGAPVGIDRGFAYAPGANVVDDVRRAIRDKADKLPKPLAVEVKAAMEDVSLSTVVRDVSRRVLDSARRDEPGIEYAGLIDKDGKLLWIKRGAKSEVQFSTHELAQMRGGVLSHNHPSSQSLSFADLRLVANTGLKRIYAVGHDGSVYAARVPAGVTESKLITSHIEADRQVFDLVNERVNSGAISIPDANRYHYHVVNLLLSRRGIIRYHAVLPSKTPQWVYNAVRSLEP